MCTPQSTAKEASHSTPLLSAMRQQRHIRPWPELQSHWSAMLCRDEVRRSGAGAHNPGKTGPALTTRKPKHPTLLARRLARPGLQASTLHPQKNRAPVRHRGLNRSGRPRLPNAASVRGGGLVAEKVQKRKQKNSPGFRILVLEKKKSPQQKHPSSFSSASVFKTASHGRTCTGHKQAPGRHHRFLTGKGELESRPRW